MLLIHGSLAIGGIETFFVRLAKERANKNLSTKILLLSPPSMSNTALIEEARLYADVHFLNEFIAPMLAKILNRSTFHASSVLPLNKKLIRAAFDSFSSVHVSNGFCAHFAFRLMSLLKINVPLSIGLYHSLEFCWGDNQSLPYYEKCNRDLFGEVLNRKNLIFFNEALVKFYETKYKKSFSCVNLFPLGVIDLKKDVKLVSPPSSDFIIGSVGRLVGFKSYNFWMLGIVKELRNRNIPVKYVIYGDGPQKGEISEKIKALNIQEYVSLEGILEHSKFAERVSQLDIFIGSGTAIVEAAGSGVPSVVGIENLKMPMTYGFLSDIPGFSYNEDNLYPKKPALQLFLDYYTSGVEFKEELKQKHIDKSKLFSIQRCSDNFNNLNLSRVSNDVINKKGGLFFRLAYCASFLMFSISVRLKGEKTLSDIISTPAGS